MAQYNTLMKGLSQAGFMIYFRVYIYITKINTNTDTLITICIKYISILKTRWGSEII